jgi:hypothetical protein
MPSSTNVIVVLMWGITLEIELSPKYFNQDFIGLHSSEMHTGLLKVVMCVNAQVI